MFVYYFDVTCYTSNCVSLVDDFTFKYILTSQNLTPDHVIKINIWATEEIDWDHFDKIWNRVFGATPLQ
ncbi:hypothetical protein GCM10010913_38050 [Paenibacillus aceti]|uniref:Uncharacterized protein n=1 Tax=Paenibacillus aceti TaxID=1820010 RepID=A0ABQ1W4U4_9BACL|nr:hypothetical protein GCM10010913_38050 [Paenibacillus aceti]